MTTHQDAAAFSPHHTSYDPVVTLWHERLQKLRKIVSFSSRLNILFGIICLTEVICFFSFFSWIGESSVIGFTLALFFLTLFAYASLRLYLQTKKPEDLKVLCEEYISCCKEYLDYEEGSIEHAVALATALQKFAAELHDKEYSYYTLPPSLAAFCSICEKVSAFFHWKDLHIVREYLLSKAVAEHLKVVKNEPTNLEVHAALANAYVLLSRLYADPRVYEGHDEEKWFPPMRFSQNMRERFLRTAQSAIEEFKILNDYAPDDPWVHMQLAYSYHDLQMPDEEIKEYEILLKLSPDNFDALFKLGLLYFQQGKNSYALKIYEKLKNANPKKAEHLIKFYGGSALF